MKILKLFLLLIVILSGAVSLAQIQWKLTSSESIIQTVRVQQTLAAGVLPGSTLFEASFPLNFDQTDTERDVKTSFFVPGNLETYGEIWTSWLPTGVVATLEEQFYHLLPMGGAHFPGQGRQHAPEPENLHPAITNWTVELQEIRAGLAKTGLTFRPSSTIQVLTVARARQRVLYRDVQKAHPELAPNQAVIIVNENAFAPERTHYCILHGASGEILGQGSVVIARPTRPPLPPGASSSGGGHRN